MQAIVTITLNPAIDKSCMVGALAPERKLQCSPPVFEPGGGGVNVARALIKLGGNASAIYFAGGYTGKFFTQLLDGEGVQSHVIEIGEHTRENLVVLDNSSNLQYRFGMPGPTIKESEWKLLIDILDKCEGVEFMVASGSVPKGVPADIFARIAFIAKKKKIRFILDTSGDPLKCALEEGVYLCKPNLGELSSLAGLEELNLGMAEEVAKSIISNGRCEVLVVSMGASGAILVTPQEVRRFSPPPVKIRSTVGAGDSMVAGIVLGLMHQKSLPEAVRYGVACGTAATMSQGTGLCKKEEVERIFSASSW